MAGFFTYLANSSFVMIDHYGLSPTLYSVAFGVNAAAFFGAAQLNGPLCERFGIVRVVQVRRQRPAASMMLAMFAYFLSGGDRLAVLIVLYFIASGLMGLVIPTTSVLALEKHGAIAGTASALLGTLQMLTGAVVMAVVGAVHRRHGRCRWSPAWRPVRSSRVVLTWLTLGRAPGDVCAAG